MMSEILKLIESVKTMDTDLAIIFVVGLGFFVLLLTLVK